jgi:hypothetical protein
MICAGGDVNTEASASKEAARSAVTSSDAELVEWIALRLSSFDPEREGALVVAREIVAQVRQHLS